MTRIQLALASAITAMLIVAGGVVNVRMSATPAGPAFIAGGRATGSTPPLAAAPPRVPSPLSAPLSSPKSLESALAAAGYKVPPGAAVYAAKVLEEDGGLTYDDYQAGGGALASNFWPASSIKVLAALGALEYVGRQGFTGAASVSVGGKPGRTLRSIYDGAIRDSSNEDYDLLVELAGLDWLNDEFLTAARGFPVTVIQRSYTVGGNLRTNPSYTLAEGGRRYTVPARTGRVKSGCPAGNCSNLFEMSESVRRVVLHDEIPEPERFKISSADAAGLTASLLGAEGYFEPAVARVLGSTARVYKKPGWVPGRDCMDVSLITGRNGQRLLLSATVPERQGGCPVLVELVTGVLRVLTA